MAAWLPESEKKNEIRVRLRMAIWKKMTDFIVNDAGGSSAKN
jgi:hypothetical protein